MGLIQIYNSIKRKKEAIPRRRKLRLFVCGPTVYDYPHLGNARTFMSFDIIVRYLRSRKIKIQYIQNITDIDDKIIKKAEAEKTNWKTISRRYEKIFLKNVKQLGINAVDEYARATDFMPQIVNQVRRLIKNGNAYLIAGDGYYFDLKTFPDYGKLAGRTIEQAEDATSRIDASDKKRNKGDFAVWKFSHKGEPGWKTAIGFGRPGWHIEDTAISEHFFGLQYELHGGGLDLKFPHHEAEIAQAESLSKKKPFVKIWMHAGFLFVSGKKMAKSAGNFITIEDFLKKYPPELFRWIVLRHHYRMPIDYTAEVIAQSRSELTKIHQFIEKLKIAAKFGNSKKKTGIDIKSRLKLAAQEHDKAMEDDFNTPFVLMHLFALGMEFQKKIWQLKPKDATILYKYIDATLKTLGLELKPPKIPQKVIKLSEKRDKLRRNKQFMQSDLLRKQINSLGYLIEDIPAGRFIWPEDDVKGVQ